MRSWTLVTAFLIAFVVILMGSTAHATLMDQVNTAFRTVYGRNPNYTEWSYWAGRVQNKEKTTYDALVGAMGFQKAQGGSPTLASSSPAASGFKVDAKFYPSSAGPNFLPDGTLIKSPTSPNVFYIRGGKKSWVIPGVMNKWMGENHFFKQNMILTLSEADLASYASASSVNKIYIGKILIHPNSSQYYIDDKLRKRPISKAVRGALKFPGGNAYPTSAAHLSEFKTGPSITRTDVYPGGMAIYDGPYHGGRIWQTREAAGGNSTKHLYLKDRFYEADGYPDESQRAGVNAETLAKHTRGANIDRYPDGWVIAIGGDIFVMQNGKRRLITSPNILSAMGYTEANIRREYPELYKTLAQGNPITAFKNIVVGGAASNKGSAAAAPSSASNLIKVRPEIRSLISQVNTIALPIYDREITVAENRHWVDHLYNGEVGTKQDLINAMKQHVKTGKLPARTSRTGQLSENILEKKWFPYLFYFVHQSEPSEDARNYWFSRIHAGDRDSIEKLGGTLQWLKDTQGLTHR